MSDQLKLDDDGICPTCDNLAVSGEHVQCFSCNGSFHVACKSATGDDKVATRTTINNFLLPSTKKNFLFFCDRCVTEMEINKSESEARRIDLLERKMSGMDQKLGEIMFLLQAPQRAANEVATPPKPKPKANDNLWFDVDRLAEVKAPSPKAVLVINNTSDPHTNEEAQETIEKVIVDNAVPLKNSHKNRE